MRTGHRQAWYTGFLLILILSVVGVLLYLRPTSVAALVPCGLTSTNPCGIEKLTTIALTELQITPQPAATTIPPTPNPNITPIPPGYIPPEAMRITPVDLNDIAEFQELRNTNSVWAVGSVLAPDGVGYNRLYVWARPGGGTTHALLGLFLVNGTGEQEQFHKDWEAPRDLGTITITNVTQIPAIITTPVGLISFTTSSGEQGVFNMATGIWTFLPANPISTSTIPTVVSAPEPE